MAQQVRWSGCSALEEFLARCDLAMDCNPRAYRKDNTKINAVGMRLSGAPFSAFTSEHAKSSTARADWFADYAKFKTYLRETYGDDEAEYTAELKLRALNSGKTRLSVPMYNVQFDDLAAKTQWNDAAKLLQYKTNLPEKYVLAIRAFRTDKPKTLAAYQKEASELWRQDQLRQVTAAAPHQSAQAAAGRTASSTPATKAKTEPKAAKPHAHLLEENGKLKREEYEKRKANGSCMRCGQHANTTPCAHDPKSPNYTPNLPVRSLRLLEENVEELSKN